VGQTESVKTIAVAPIFVKRPEGRLIMRQVVKAGDKVTIQLVGGEKWSPFITLTSVGKELGPASPMTKVASDGKVTTFEYLVPQSISQVVPVGTAVTALVTEKLTGFSDQGTFVFSSVSLDDLAGQIAAAGGSKSLAQDTLSMVKRIQSDLNTDGHISRNLEFLKQKIDRIPKAVAEEGGTVQMRKAVNEVADTIKQLAGSEGYDFSQLVKKGIEEAPSLKDVRQKTDEIQGAAEVMQILMERKFGGVDEPVVHVTYQ
jgi:hypothetical protein